MFEKEVKHIATINTHVGTISCLGSLTPNSFARPLEAASRHTVILVSPARIKLIAIVDSILVRKSPIEIILVVVYEG